MSMGFWKILMVGFLWNGLEQIEQELIEGVNFPINMLYAKMLQSAGNLYGELKNF